MNPPASKNSPPIHADAHRIEAAIAGDEAAWRALVERYSSLVYSVPRRLGLSQEEAENVFQDVFAALVRQLPHMRDVQSIPKWFITTAHRISWRAIRKRREHTALSEMDAPAANMERDVPPPDLIERWERAQLVRQALNQLGGRCRDLLHELYLSPNPAEYQEIARRLKLPLGSIGPTRGRCMAKLLEILRSMGFPEAESEEL